MRQHNTSRNTPRDTHLARARSAAQRPHPSTAPALPHPAAQPLPPRADWGYVTTCGTEGNLHAMLLARECHPEGIIYTSTETHYSIFKAARYYR